MGSRLNRKKFFQMKIWLVSKYVSNQLLKISHTELSRYGSGIAAVEMQNAGVLGRSTGLKGTIGSGVVAHIRSVFVLL
jgi:hypothetical protein